MDAIWYAISAIVGAAISGLVTYLVTIKKADTKIKKIELQNNSDLEKLELKHQHEIEKIKSDHQNEIEKLKLAHSLEKDSKSDDLSTKLLEMFLSGQLDITNISSKMDDLIQLKNKIDRQNSKSKNSQFVKQKKRH